MREAQQTASPAPSFSLITSIEELPSALAASVTREEGAYIKNLRARGGLPFAVSPRFASLAGTEQDDPIRRQFMPDPRESMVSSFALEDPLGEALYRKTPRLVHQYRDRALLLAGGACAGYCRFCFRRARMSSPAPFIGGAGEECADLRAHPEIREILLSGGDPLSAGDGELEALFASLRGARPGVLLRLCTRVPVTAPRRLGPETAAFLARWKPLRLAVHVNHPRELEGPAGKALAACVDLGIPVHVQTVLLRRINDRAETLAVLFWECLSLGLTPYYLFQLDLAPGTDHFRVPLKEGLRLYEELKLLVSGLALPAYAVDLPGGGGKIRLHRDIIAGETKGPNGEALYLLPGPGGKLWPYPADMCPAE
jgi:lysine 2,3-aminomutase